ncbi:tol-pal system protein YbgF [Desulfobacula phenolica]|uniref:Tol-pal system protein YbgF n=1 Tax=Desulfobacula phenolica TaxID=90732 RepID=A0A1H2DQ58_9BACT|nr:tol-pal system protein YbgF [Desulfobacula phenolica]SDT84508.1 tol-pal system protein YbgF [Desulfobacula phenolica]
MRIKYLFGVVVIVLVFSGCVESQSFVILENKVATLELKNKRQTEKSKESAVQNEQIRLKFEQNIESIEKRLNESHSISQEEYAEMKDTIQSIKSDIQRLQGMIEEINHSFAQYRQNDSESIEKKIDRLDQAVSKNYEKVIALEKYMGFEPSAAGKIEKKAVSSIESGKTAELELYEFAKKLFDEGDKENARIRFENFINKYPDSNNADNARFWIADSYYAEKWFEKAILEYQKVLEVYPNSNKLAAARLKQGYAFAELGEKANARLILKELLKKHPDSNEAKYAQKKLKSLK